MAADERNAFEVYRDRVDRPLGRLFREYGASEAHWLVIGMVANVVARVAGLIPPVVLGVAIDAVFTGSGPYTLPIVPDAWLPTAEAAQFHLSVILIFGSFIVTGVFTYVYGIAANNFAHRVMHAVRTDSFDQMQRLDMTFFDDKQTGEVMSVLNNDASNLEVFLDNALQNSARLGVMVVGIATVLVYYNYELAVITLAAIPLMFLFTLWFMRAVEPRYVAQRSVVGDLNTALENALSGVELVKTSNTEAYESERVEDASFSYFRRTMSILRLNYVYRPGMELLAGLAFAATFAVGGFWLANGPPGPFSTKLTVGTFVTFVLLTQQFVAPLAEVSNIIDQYENAKASCERVFGLRDIPVRIEDDDDAIELGGQTRSDGGSKRGRGVDGTVDDATEDAVDDATGDAADAAADHGGVAGAVEYDEVSFAYPGNALVDPEDADEEVLSGVSFSADPGDTVALVGPTGAGKSTLLKLLLRLYDVTDGAIRVDGHDVRDVTVESLRSSVGYVAQDTTLFDGTIAENIRYGRFTRIDEADAEESEVRERVVEAAKAAEAHEFIASLPNGYETRIGERGVKLSGGQRQRLAIARVVLQDPAILILDEATSAVDTETEMLIQRSLDRLAADRTTFVIAHRLSTVTDADTALVLEDGEVVERGSHDELLAADGLYAKLWGVQAGEIDELPEEFVERARERHVDRAVERATESEVDAESLDD
ncbi:ABC transporter ATP-binding protein [Halorubrum ezzemoulense]|uniref:ABC transporter ATP-binding protein n=1 Tax=Halorubrum ezzemoulense TaxID=337243 RepID=A0A256KKE0_HALEZ|nr:ABC transporter ATP-binding protein [Halorubrum ezzemoulense]OYR76496.1 multidrug ABC transporter ATP-binding protein [Halorubrum ezzemoulense]OYR81183.1 multidrug ABC transporter ATP-binding protein [Halorubrum ezzemoulense]QAY19399.1 ABC transporter ATP-binding protein [Halorubrum ezzemoulense]